MPVKSEIDQSMALNKSTYIQGCYIKLPCQKNIAKRDEEIKDDRKKRWEERNRRTEEKKKKKETETRASTGVDIQESCDALMLS